MSQYQNTVAFQAPTDYNLEQQGVDRQRKLAEALMQQSQQPMSGGEMVGNRFVPKSWTESLSQALKGPLSMFMQGKADTDAKDIASRQREAYAAELSKFGETMNGTPAKPGGELAADGYGPETPATAAVPGNRQQALAMALGSQNPMLQKYGMEQMLPKAPEWVLGERFNAQTGQPEKFMYNKLDPSQMQQIGGQKAANGVAINGQLVNPATGGRIGEAVPKQLAPDSIVTAGPDGKLMPNLPVIGAKSQVARAGASNVSVVNQGPKAFQKELGELDAKQLDKYRTSAETAQSTIGTVQALRAAEKQGAFSGGLADAKLAASNLLNGIAGVEIPGLVGSQVYNAEASKLVLDRVKALGANPSNADRAFIEKTVPQLATSQTARTQMADFMEKKAAQQIDLYKRADAHARKNDGLGGFDQFEPPKAGVFDQTAIDAEIARRAGKR